MSPAFISGVSEHIPNAEITFDRFHIMKIVNEAVDKVRKNGKKIEPCLKKTKYFFLTNRENLKEEQLVKLEMLEDMKGQNLKTIRAMHMKENFQDIYKVAMVDNESFESLLKKWYNWAIRSRLQPMVNAARIIKKHWKGIVNWHKSRISNGILEGLNSLIQAAKAKARGYRTITNLKIISYLIVGVLDLSSLNSFITITDSE